MKWSSFGRVAMALTSAAALGLSMTACGGGTIAYLWAVGTTATTTGPTGTTATASGQIVGYLVDNYTGNLTSIPGQPFSSSDSNPTTLVVRPGGRFIYVINQGTGYTTKVGGTSEGVDLFAVGGTGTLTFEQHYTTQGFGHLWAAFDSTGGFLYVLDKYSPSGDGNGAVTTFASDPTTGRLNLVQQTASTQPGQISPTYLEVGQSPIRMLSTGNCLFTANAVGQTISTYSISNGQLGTVTTGLFPVGSTSITSIAGNAQYVFVTDNMNLRSPGQIFSYSIGSNCSLVPFTAAAVTPNSATAVNPINIFLAGSSKYVYVLNGSSTNTATNAVGSSLSGFVINGGQLQPISGSPFATGSGPECMVEDPTSKYLYVADGLDGAITGYLYADPTGEISNLSRGSTFKTSTIGLTCLAISGSI